MAVEQIFGRLGTQSAAAKYVTQRRFEKLSRKLEDREQAVTFETLYDRVLEGIVREAHKQLYHGDETVDMQMFRSEVGTVNYSALPRSGLPGPRL